MNGSSCSGRVRRTQGNDGQANTSLPNAVRQVPLTTECSKWRVWGSFPAFDLFCHDEDAYFVLMFAILAVAGLLARVINLPGIVGAFLAGLAVNAAVQDKPAKDKMEFIGNSVFIPIFFIATGFLIDPIVFFHSITDNLALTLAIIVALLTGKWIAAQIAGRQFAYSASARRTMWSLTLPQVAATLAATLAAFDTFSPAGQRLIDRELLNVVLVLMLTTSILGPILTERFAPRMLEDEAEAPSPREAA